MSRAVFALASLVALSGGALHGCRYRPALFADHPVVAAVEDDRPIPLPSRRSFDEREHVSDIYLRRPLFDVVHPVDFPTAGDVNSMDEVASSSWYDPQASSQGKLPPPTPPFWVVDEDPLTVEGALVVRDTTGARYELLSDPKGKEGLVTGSEVLAGHLLRALGLRAPMSWIVDLPERAIAGEGDNATERLRRFWGPPSAPGAPQRRFSATLWPGGIDLGVISDYEVRRDDPNDTVPHHDRRTLRAMKVFGHWMGWAKFGVRNTRDVYVGKPGEGHLLHYVVGGSRAFGTEDLQETPTRDENSGSFFWKLVTLGLSPPTLVPARRPDFPSLGYLPPTLTPGTYDVTPPYSPFVRFTAADEYWAAKRLMEAGDEALGAGLAAARLPADAALRLTEVLRSRRSLLVTHGMSVVTPLDPSATSGRAVWLRDRAISAGLAVQENTRYDVSFLDRDGHELAPPKRLDADGVVTSVALPPGIEGLVVLHVQVSRKGNEAPRACDFHVLAEGDAVRIIAVRH